VIGNKLTKAEQEVVRVRDLMVEEGLDSTTASRYALTALAKPDEEFVKVLSDETLALVEGKVVIVEQTEE